MAVRFPSQPCQSCGRSADFFAPSLSCERCSTTYEKLCPECAQKPCGRRRCSGKLVQTELLFPHSLFRAIRTSDVDEVRRISAQHADKLDTVTDKHGETPLSRATRAKGRGAAKTICELLLKQGASPQARNRDERSALIEMVHDRVFDKEVAWLLRASINDQDREGSSALMFAGQGGGAFGSRRGNLTIARNLLELGANPNLQNRRGRTALHYAMASNDTDQNNEMIDFLQSEMIKAAALAEFRSRNSISFTAEGVLKATSKGKAAIKPRRRAAGRATRARK